ncbi:GntR family transcriptional regulator [Planctomycetota bacterium]
MLLLIDHHSGLPIYRQVMDQVRRQIMTQGLNVGKQLPTVRELAARLRVNPMTISKAYSLLEAEGLLERRRGIGLFVGVVKTPKQQKIKSELLQQVVDKAAVTAVQLQVSEDQAIKLFQKLYRQHTQDGRKA